MTHFSDFGLSDALNISLEKMGYAAPTPIQEKAIPFALEGRDILGSAQTGTGKTAAFSIPLVESILRSENGSALVLTPTRELAKQVLDVITQLLGNRTPIKTAFIIGGESMAKQFSQLKAQPRIIVGTPGRVNDHLERGTLRLNNAGFLVLDETDRMLDMGFGIQLDRIMKYMPQERQTLMFSATMPREIVSLSGKYLTNPQRIAIGASNEVAKNIEQEVVRIQQERKYDELLNQLNARDGSVIVFSKTKHGADRIAKNLRRDGFESDALHGDLRQGKRTSVMNNFRNKKFRILVATDIAARGLDVPHIEHVINFDLPQVAEDYIHRMGRTARAGAKGSAVCFISPQEGRQWSAIERLLNPDAAPSRDYSEGGRGNSNGRGRSNGPARPASKKFGSKFRPAQDGEARSNDFRSSKPRSAEGGRSFEGRSFEGRSEGARSSENRPSEGRSEYRGNRDSAPRGNSEGRSNDFRASKPRSADGERSFKPRQDDNRGNSFRSNEGRPAEGERSHGTPRSNAFRDGKPRSEGARSSEGRPSEGRSEYRGNRDNNAPRGNTEGRSNDFRSSKPRSAEGGARSSEGRSEYRGNKTEGGNGEARGNNFRSNEGRKDAPRGGKPAFGAPKGKSSFAGAKSKPAGNGGNKPFTKKARPRTAA